MKASICFEMLYEGLNPVDKVKKIAEHGFKYYEFWGWRDKDLQSLKEVSNIISASNFSGQRKGDLVCEKTHDTLLVDFNDALKATKILKNDTLMILAHELGSEGEVVNSYSDISDSDKRRALINGLKKILEVTPSNFNIVLEPLNIVLDHVGYYLHDIPTAVDIIREIGDERLSILCDLYHQGMMGDDLINIINKYSQYIGYYHVADVPNRHEPGTGTINWKEVLTAIKNTGYKGFVGFEFSPEGDSDKALDAIHNLWESII